VELILELVKHSRGSLATKNTSVQTSQYARERQTYTADALLDGLVAFFEGGLEHECHEHPETNLLLLGVRNALEEIARDLREDTRLRPKHTERIRAHIDKLVPQSLGGDMSRMREGRE